jgi:hypothetical protein
MRKLRSGVLALCAGLLFLAGAAPAWAHTFQLDVELGCVGPTCVTNETHVDFTPFKGWAQLTVTNNGSVAWGDFHFGLFNSGYGIDPADVFFQVEGDKAPQSSQSITWSPLVDGSQTLDVYFYGDPVGVGETLSINIYTNNAGELVSFGTLFYPTPIPEPGTAALMGLSLLGLLAAGRRVRRR